MLKLTIEIDELDYDSLAEKYLPALTDYLARTDNPAGRLLSGGVPVNVAKAVLRSMTQEKKDRLCAELINGNSQTLRRRAEELAAKQGIGGHIKNFRAEVI